MPLDADPSKIGVLGRKLQRNENIQSSHYAPPSSMNSLSKDSVLQFNDEDGIDYKDISIGPVDDTELIESIVRASEFLDATSCPDDSSAQVRDLVLEYKDIFRVRLGHDPPVQFASMTIEFMDSVKPVHVRKRTYSPEDLESPNSKVQALIDAGFIYRNTTSNWACAPLERGISFHSGLASCERTDQEERVACAQP